jgi:hypothetical protein
MDDQTAVALEIYKALRAEVVERIKLRDQILLAYMAAVAALIGFSVKENPPQSLLTASMVLLPFLAIGAASAIAQHQENVTSLVRYYASTLLQYLPAGSTAVTPFEHTDTAVARKRSLNLIFLTQLTMICGPFVFAATYTASDLWHATRTRTLFVSGSLLTSVAATILWRSRSDRNRVLEELQREGRSHKPVIPLEPETHRSIG